MRSSHFPGLCREHPPWLRNYAMLAGEGGSCYITVLYCTDFKCYTTTSGFSHFFSDSIHSFPFISMSLHYLSLSIHVCCFLCSYLSLYPCVTVSVFVLVWFVFIFFPLSLTSNSSSLISLSICLFFFIHKCTLALSYVHQSIFLFMSSIF